MWGASGEFAIMWSATRISTSFILQIALVNLDFPVSSGFPLVLVLVIYVLFLFFFIDMT